MIVTVGVHPDDVAALVAEGRASWHGWDTQGRRIELVVLVDEEERQ